MSMRVLRWALGCLLLLLLLALAGLWVYTRLARPQTDGALTVRGPLAELRIERDTHGIPTIHAASAEDAWFGLGFAHAQDRLWQLETHRRLGSGRLAEAFGANALEADKFLRALGVRRAAAEQWAKADADTRRTLEAYAAGINAALRQPWQTRAPEFLLLGIKPEDWSPVDSLAWGIMMAWDLGGNWNSELLRMRLAGHMPVERIGQLLPPSAGDAALPVSDFASLYRSLGVHGATDVMNAANASATARSPWLDRLLLDAGVEGAGSNNWVVDGAHSSSGRPLLANDPHLKLSAPALWYLARIEAPGLKVAGATLPGLPLVVLGQNEHIAWGFTNTGPDVQDLYLEKIHPADADRYLESGTRWARFERFDEVIKVKGRPDVRFTARRSRHGPLISDAETPATAGLTGSADSGGQRYAIALRWTALDPDAASVGAGLAFNRARSVNEFIAASARYVAPMQNMVVADRERIAFVAAGRVPLRRADNSLHGQAPAPGWEPRYDWDGFLPPAQTPRELAPARGWIATANQRIHGPDYPHFIGSEWALPYRQQRIETLLQARPTHDVASLRAIQLDQFSLATQRLLPLLRAARSTHPLASAAQAELRDFEGVMSADAAAPLIVWAWVRELTTGIFADEVGTELFERQLGTRTFRDALEAVLERDDASWCNQRATVEAETCAEQIDAAFTRALTQLAATQGNEVERWRWGALHQARAEHRPFSRVPLLARLFELRTPVGGDTYTVNVSRVALKPDVTTGELFLDEHGPSLRAIYDLGDRSRSRFIHSSGQSGLFFDRHYRDLLAPWARGEDLPVWGDGAPPLQVLTLTPR